MITLCDRMRVARAKAGLTQDAVGYELGISQFWYGQIENGTSTDMAIVARLVKIAEILNVNPVWLILGKGSVHRETKCAD